MFNNSINKALYLASGEDGHVTLALAQKGQVTRREMILLLGFASGQVKYTVPNPTSCFENSVDSCIGEIHTDQQLLLRSNKDRNSDNFLKKHAQ